MTGDKSTLVPTRRGFGSDEIQRVQDLFAQLTGMSFAFLTDDGQLLGKPSAPFCQMLIWQLDEPVCENCGWMTATQALLDYETHTQQECPLKFKNSAFPVLMNRIPVGSVVVGIPHDIGIHSLIGADPYLSDLANRVKIWSQIPETDFLNAMKSFTTLVAKTSFMRAQEKVRTVGDILMGISPQLETATVLDLLHSQLLKLMPFDSCTICFYRPGEQVLRAFCSKGVAESILRDATFSIGEGYAGYVAGMKSPLIVKDVRTETEHKIKYKELVEAGLRSYLVVPMLMEHGLLGVIMLASTRADSFTDEDAHIVTIIANHLSGVFTLRKVMKELRRINTIQPYLYRGIDEDKELFHVLTALSIEGGLGFNRAILFLVHTQTKESDPSNRVVRGRMAIGPADEQDAKHIYEDRLWASRKSFDELMAIVEREFDANRNAILYSRLNMFARQTKFSVKESNVITRSIFEDKKPRKYNAQLEDLNDDMLYKLLSSKGMEAKEFVVAPLLSHDEAIGAIYADHKFDKRPITEEDIYLLNTYIMQVGAIIHKSLAVKNKQRTLMLETYHALGAKITQINDTCVKLEIAAKRAGVIEKLGKKIDGIKEAIEDANRVMRNSRDLLGETKPNRSESSLEAAIQKDNLLSGINVDPTNVLFRIERGDETICCDFDCLKNDILRELVTNSLKHSQKGSGLCIAIDLFLKNYGETKVLEISYRDNGIGIPQDHREKIFEPFFTTATEVEGDGIGLALIKKRIEALGGWIKVADNPEGTGVLFIAGFPV